MIHADLFSGIGGFSLAARAMNWETAFHCEIEPFCQRVLKHHFPESFLYENIFTTDFTIYRGRIDLLTGGFLASPSPLPDYKTARKITATSGRKCSERFGRYNPGGSWQKTFLDLLVTSPAWYSSRSVLTWKMKATKSKRLYFLLWALIPRTSGTESLLLLTPVCMDTGMMDLGKIDKRRACAKAKKINGNGFGMSLMEVAQRGLIPAPAARDYRGTNSQNIGAKERDTTTSYQISF
jgi:hypothetical protein